MSKASEHIFTADDYHPCVAYKNGQTYCRCGWVSSEQPTETMARHMHAAHAWVAEPYMTA